MTTVVACPACQQNLQVPPERAGQAVRCPGCQHVFTAGTTAVRAALPPPLPVVEDVPVHDVVVEDVPAWEQRPQEDDLARPLGEDEADVADALRRKRRNLRRKGAPDSPYYDELTRRQRKMQTPHRGVLILVYGIISLFCSMGLLGVYFGVLAWQWGNNDLQEMTAGRMDRNGETLTQVGRILGMIGTGLAVVSVIGGCTCGMFSAVASMQR